MNAYLVSRFLHAFPGERPPNPPPESKAIEIRSWTVEQPLQTLTFEDEAWAVRWCQKQGIEPTSLQYHHKTVPRQQFAALANLLEQQQSGASVGAMAPNTFKGVPAQYLDGLFEWFKAQPQIDMTAPLVKMAFSVNRVDVAQYIGTMMQKVLPYWVTPLEVQPFEDPLVPDELNRMFRDAILNLAPHPREMQWFLEHNPVIKEICQRPPLWEKMDYYVQAQAIVELKTSWPWIAHTVFEKDIDPTDAHSLFLVEPHFWRLLTSYAHDKAAQCSLVQQKHALPKAQAAGPSSSNGLLRKKIKYQNYEEYSRPYPTRTLTQKKERAFIAKEALALNRHLQNQPEALDKELRACIQLLSMGLDEGCTKESFYAHAKQVLNPQTTPEVTLPCLD